MANVTTSRGISSLNFQSLLLPILGALFMIPLMFLAMHGQFRLSVTAVCLISMLVLWRINHTAAICFNFAYLIVLGDIRRIVDTFAGTIGLDPLLVVGAIFSLCVGLPLFRRLRVKDSLSKVMLALLGIMILEIFNPKQHSLFVGLSAGLFWIVPLMWFWIGRRYATEAMVAKLLYGVVVPLGIFAAFLGLYQTYVGFLPWEQTWIDHAIASGYTSLYLSGKVRAFGFSVNAVEFIELMSIACVLIGPLVKTRKAIYVLFLPVLAMGIFFGSSRTVILKLIVAYAAMWAVRGYATSRAKVIPRMVFALFLGLGALTYSIGHLASDENATNSGTSTAAVAQSHVVQGLAHPLDAKTSTAGLHAGMFSKGILSGIINPVGYGLGSTTLGAGKFSGDQGNQEASVGTSEIDISDSFISMGIPGGICFLLMIYQTVRYLLHYLINGNAKLTYGLVGVFVVMLGGWIGPGRYALAPLMCFLIGFLTKQHLDHRQPVIRQQRFSRYEAVHS